MTIDPILMCKVCGTPTLHIFVERRSLTRRPGELAYTECFYECDGCGATRAWGNEPRAETAYERRLAADALAHAVDKHGMHRERCPACNGAGANCSECGNEGEVWLFDDLEPCGPACPIAALDPPERA